MIREPIQRADSREAYGSFVPVRSATASLKGFASLSSLPTTHAKPKRKRVTFVDPLSSPQKWPQDDNDNEAPLQVPFITRTLSPPPVCPPSPISSTSSMINADQPDPNPDLHPILARLEKKSKLCMQKSQCATCHKTGSDFPRCGKCNQMWCSRQCRLVGGKRHVCSA
ncbi:hypothetical protein CVT24_001565 [Panaeolus cyanescens]|uniref:HIT-type domain-containing protein n=1 Tax=Panaeolus cyanescens TaxID=181874 RepID=A0A409YFH9_9AGAR|nr:hypothetical protein CVT24_001565 [Panaeolus cyanescens]